MWHVGLCAQVLMVTYFAALLHPCVQDFFLLKKLKLTMVKLDIILNAVFSLFLCCIQHLCFLITNLYIIFKEERDRDKDK